MGCACSHQDIESEKKNEMKEENINDTLKGESYNNGENYNTNLFLDSNKCEVDNLNDASKLRSAPPQAGYENNEKSTNLIDDTIKQNNIFRASVMDSAIEDEYNKLIEQYQVLEDGIEVEKRSPQEKGDSKDNKVIYCGEWDKNKNLRHGRGIQIWPDGAKYMGYWQNDKACGKGKLIHSDGDIYEGEWSNDKPNGYGIYIHSDGTKYEGNWRDDKQNGEGKEIWPDGASYEGNYKDGKKNGQGKFLWADGSRYEGHFDNNNINGEGTYIFADNRKYIGTWVNNKLEGNGVFLWPDGRKYTGEYKNDKKEGYGVFEWPNGKIYRGQWKKGKQDGEGEFYFPTDKKWKKGIWKEGKRVKWLENQQQNQKADYF